MSFHSTISQPNYMDGVPVKISEKYKPPPKVTIPQSIINRLNSEGYPNGIFDYDFTLENNVIIKIEEWKKYRQIECEQRQERLRKHEIEMVREIEQKQKQLLTAVSYPNAEDLSSDSDDDKDQSPKTSAALQNCNQSASDQQQLEQIKQFSPLQQRCFDTILMPTVVPDYSRLNNLSEFEEQIQNYHKNPLNTGKINYSDFENDTSSPFDNIELKTINDLDVLAEVLNVTQVHSNIQLNNETNPCSGGTTIDINNQNIQNINNEFYNSSSNSTPSGDLTTTTVLTPPPPLTSQWNHTLDNNHVVHHSAPNQSNLYRSSNNYFSYDNHQTNLQNYTQNIATGSSSSSGNGSKSNTNGANTNKIDFDCNNEQSTATTTTNASTDYYYNLYNNLPHNQNYLYNNYNTDIDSSHLESPNKYSQFQNYNNTIQQPNLMIQQSPLLFHHTDIQQHTHTQNHIKNNYYNENANANPNEIIIQSVKNKSKSVPDILKELNDEIRNSEIRRARNHSQTLEDHASKIVADKNFTISDDQRRPDTFMKLSNSSQCLVKNISLMGFPLERVSKIAEKLGNDDKKIIEHLIPLSELLDLGFDEAKISEALLKFNNNKEKALDFLIS